MVIASAQDLVTTSADVLILVEPLGVGDVLSGEMRASDFMTHCALLLDRETEIRTSSKPRRRSSQGSGTRVCVPCRA